MRKGLILVDYLIILSLVLIIGLVSLVLFNAIPDFGKNFQIKQSIDFWQNQATPFTVSDSFFNSSSGRVYFAFTSHAQNTLFLTQIILNNTELAFFDYDPTTGVQGADLCDIETCKYSPCTCSRSITAYSTSRIVTEFYTNASQFCDQKTKYNLVPLTLVYSSLSDPSINLTQQSPYALALKCN